MPPYGPWFGPWFVKRRYASGEITREQFEQMRGDIS